MRILSEHQHHKKHLQSSTIGRKKARSQIKYVDTAFHNAGCVFFPKWPGCLAGHFGTWDALLFFHQDAGGGGGTLATGLAKIIKVTGSLEICVYILYLHESTWVLPKIGVPQHGW